ncbi:MAG: HEPN domain-containing protein [Bacteroidia bacterium]|nr:HEPN domain-containing protein [Bacteroidia bacterium]
MTAKRDEYIKYRFKRAEESLEDALILIEKKRWNTSINRLYYSCFYAVISLLLKNGFITKTHNGARTKFGNEFVKTGILDKKYGKLYSKLFDFRQKGDYGDLFDFDDKTVLPLVDQVREFISMIKGMIEK